MKNLLIYINPQNKFDDKHAILAKIQIDNSLELGWKPKDIVIVTNFNYEYKGIKAKVIGEEGFHKDHVQATKFTALLDTFKKGIIKDHLYWSHDFDAFQMQPIKEEELGLDNVDVGLTTYGWLSYWCLGSLFFKKNAEDIFSWVKDTMTKHNFDDEKAFRTLTRQNFRNINKRIKKLNITYQIGMRHIGVNYRRSDKPIKVVHFNPWYKRDIKTLDVFMYGKNELNKPLMTKRLIKLFHRYGIK